MSTAHPTRGSRKLCLKLCLSGLISGAPRIRLKMPLHKQINESGRSFRFPVRLESLMKDSEGLKETCLRQPLIVARNFTPCYAAGAWWLEQTRRGYIVLRYDLLLVSVVQKKRLGVMLSRGAQCTQKPNFISRRAVLFWASHLPVLRIPHPVRSYFLSLISHIWPLGSEQHVSFCGVRCYSPRGAPRNMESMRHQIHGIRDKKPDTSVLLVWPVAIFRTSAPVIERPQRRPKFAGVQSPDSRTIQ